MERLSCIFAVAALMLTMPSRGTAENSSVTIREGPRVGLCGEEHVRTLRDTCAFDTRCVDPTGARSG